MCVSCTTGMVGTIKKDEATGNEKKHKNTFVLATAVT